MEQLRKIPEQFFGLFQSKNRYLYMEALLLLYDEYLYNDYFLTKDTCIQIVHDRFYNRMFEMKEEESEEDDSVDVSEPIATRIFNRLLYFGWIRKVEDYTTFKTNVVIPDYSSIFIEAMRKIEEPTGNDTDLYIQNVYTNIYSFYHDKKAGIELLKTAMVNTSNLNRALQDLLHNMDKFFDSLLQQENYENLLEEHLYGYVEHIVDKKYGLLKTSDNFYIYKNDIKQLLRAIQEDEERLNLLKRKMLLEGKTEASIDQEIEEMIDAVDRGISNMERRISYIDAEHTKYVRATVRRLEYLLNNDDTMSGQIVTLLNLMQSSNQDKMLEEVTKEIQIHDPFVLTPGLLYKKRGKRQSFEESIEEEDVIEELSKEEILRANRKKARYSKEQIEQYIGSRLVEGVFDTSKAKVKSEEEFELLILAYDYSLRKKSPFTVTVQEDKPIVTEQYMYPNLVFKER